jgi:UDPglucose 6-dehydrogenase
VLTANESPHNFRTLSNLVFLAEGTATKDLGTPDRGIIGGLVTEKGGTAVGVLADIYANWVPRKQVLTTNLWCPGLAKLVATARLASA